MEPETRTIAPEEVDDFSASLELSFGWSADKDTIEADRAVIEPERSLAAFERGRMVATNTVHTMTLTVPGGASVPMAGIAGVGVLPSHRRQGLTAALMRRQLDDAHARGEPLSALHASEAAIYGRFGYGVATRNQKLLIDSRRAGFARGWEPQGRMRMVDRPEGEPIMLDVLRQGADRPGWVGDPARFLPRQIRGWELDEKDEAPLWAVHEDERGAPDGVVVYRVTHKWPGALPSSKLKIMQLIAASPAAIADAWRFALDMDLIATVEAWDRPADQSLFRLFREPRAMRARTMDGMHVRLLDLAPALQARSYAADGRLVLSVRDEFCDWNDGSWALEAEGGVATCAPSMADPDIEISTTDLAATYLGDVGFRDLALSLRVRAHGDGALERADAMFAFWPTPWCWLDF